MPRFGVSVRVYLIRHGETDWNRQEKLQGHSNIALNDLGRVQARNLSVMVAGFGITRVISSDLDRAVETAQIAFPKLSAHIETDPRLREVHLGQAEGRSRHDLEADFGAEMIRAWFSTEPTDLQKRFPEGESRAQALERMRESIFEHAAKAGDGALAFVTHGLVIRTLTQFVVGSYRPEFRAPNCAVFEFELRKGSLPDELHGHLHFVRIHRPYTDD